MAVAKDDKPTFRCRFCGHLEDAGHAGENSVPLACSVCGSGVSFHPRTGMKFADPTNWEVLEDLDDDALKAVGLTMKDVGSPREDGVPVTQNAQIVGRMLTGKAAG